MKTPPEQLERMRKLRSDRKKDGIKRGEHLYRTPEDHKKVVEYANRLLQED